jgi:cytochrome c oxidase assembly factor CtaG
MYATPLFARSLTTPLVHLLVHAHLVLIGLLFFWPLVGFDPAPVRVPHPARALLIMVLPLHALLAVALMAPTRPSAVRSRSVWHWPQGPTPWPSSGWAPASSGPAAT